MRLSMSKLGSIGLLSGVAISTCAVWIWGDAGLDKVVVPPPAVASAPTRQQQASPSPVTATVSGVASVETTNVLVIGDRRLVLAGIMPVNHEEAVAALRAFLGSAGTIGCHEAAGGGWFCEVHAGGSDVGEIAVLSGLAFTGPGAPQRYMDAEKTAKQRKAGIWGAS